MKKKWWHEKIGYQIYPKSFLDTNGDGVGDLKGVIEKLPYLEQLGVDILWLSPVYPSPMVDNGYDISDYGNIDPRFGTLEDMDRLIAEAKKKNISIIMDLVVNHCSDQHAWFQKAIADPKGPYGDYFYLKEGKDGKEPNNWRSYFGGSVWEKLPGQENLYYYHAYAKEQPDLNWENPALREEIYKMVNWWLDRGIAGFRIDAIINIKKDLTWEDLPVDGPDGRGFLTNSITRMQKRDGGTKNGIGVFLRELKERCFAPHDAFTVGEVFEVDREQLEEFIGEDGYFSTMFAFDPIQSYKKGTCQCEFDRNMNPDEWKQDVFVNQKLLGDIAFEANIIENHDMARGATIYIPDEDYGFASISALAGLQVLQRGMPFLYQGQEIGMTNCVRNDISEYDDISTKDQYQAALNAGCSKEAALHACYENSRDNARTPMQWDNSLHGGFTTGTPWLAENPNYTKINVTDQLNRPDSVLSFYKELIALRKAPEYVETFTYGTFAAAYEDVDHMFAYYRTNEETGQRILVAGNFGTDTVTLPLEKPADRVLLTNGKAVDEILNKNGESATLLLGSCDCVVLLSGQ